MKLTFLYLHACPLYLNCRSVPFIATYIIKLSIFSFNHHFVRGKVRKHSQCSFKNHMGLPPVQCPCHLPLTCPPPPSPILPGGQHSSQHTGPGVRPALLSTPELLPPTKSTFFPHDQLLGKAQSPRLHFYLIPQNKQISNQFAFHLKTYC